EEQAINTYNKNIIYLTEEHPHLADDLKNLDLAIHNNIVTEQYSLEYVDDNFDIKDINNSTYMYSRKSNDFAKTTAEQINFNKYTGSIEGMGIYDINKIDIENPELLYERKDVYRLMTYHVNNVDHSNQMKKIRKFIFIGVGLGLHITKIDEKINASDYLIVEDNLEIFKLSLFTTDYADIAKRSRLTFSILEDNVQFTKKFDSFLNNNFAYNRFLKYVRVNNHSHKKISLIQSSIANQSFVSFAYKKRLEMSMKPLSYINDDYTFLDLHKHIQNDLFPAKPVLIVAAGPSFKKNVLWLKKNHSKFIIIAASATIKTLHSYDIKPNIVTHIDGSELCSVFFEGIDVKEYLKDSVFIVSAMTHNKIVDLLPKKQTYLFETLTQFHNNYKVITTECVGSFSLLLSLLLNTNDTYLLGLDLALDQNTGETHSNDHTNNEKVNILNSDKINTTTSLIDTALAVKGNFKDIVYTNPVLHGSIKTLERIIPEIITDKQKIYNLCDGAMISNAIATDINDINVNKLNIIDKIIINQDMHNIFENKSCKTLNKNDIESIKLELKEIIEIQKHIENFENNPSYRDSDEYINDLINLLIKILEKDKKNEYTFVEVYYDYFKYVLVIVEDFFNTKGTKNTKHHIKRINKIILLGLHDIQDTYQDALNSFISSKL
ncbi:MAG: DUF115 domain-containing protein, partial [Sulfurimonas sp.]|nr:DUF115 domain-containing protein [Sulfurimonas sp.]